MMNVVQRENGSAWSEMGASRRKKPLDKSHMTSAVPSLFGTTDDAVEASKA
jgi:hypothetical protein